MLPVYMAKAGGFFFMVFGVTALMGGLLSINPVWKFGPYDPTKVTAGSQPDWYMGWPDGALRIMPNWESHVFGHPISWNILLPIQVLPILMFTVVLLLPFLEAWISGDKREHHLLQRPRDAPTRTAFLAALMTIYGLFWAAGGNDIIATHMSMSINSITYFMRGAVFVLPPIVFLVVRRWCIGLQRADNDRLLHGYETGIIMRAPDGGYTERHLPIGEAEAFRLASRDRDRVLVPAGDTDDHGVPAPGTRGERARLRLNHAAYADNAQPPTAAEIAGARRHAEHERALEAGLDHPAEGHEFDDHQLRDADAVPLRGGHGDD
jgi:ubiquinol-cytochrome c reductase cytochrome b subunit